MSQTFNPPNRSTHDPNSIFDPAGNIRPRNASYPDPNNPWQQQGPATPPFNANVNVNTTPPGSAIEEYYRRMTELMPTNRQSAYGDLSSVLGSFSSGEKANRVTEGNFRGDYDRLMQEREASQNRLGLDAQSEYDRLKLLAGADRRDSESDAMQKLQLAGYLQGGGNASAPGGAHRAVSAAERTGAGALSEQMLARINSPAFEPTKFNPTFSHVPMDPSQYAKPGMLEKLTSYGGAGVGMLGILDKFTGGRSGDYIGKLMGKIPGVGGLFSGGGSTPGFLANAVGKGGGVGPMPPGMANASGFMGNVMGKALPVAGIVAGGYGLTKDRGLGGNMLNGAQAGAGIGTLVGGPIGTAIGAGIGAGVGALRGIGGGPSEAEKAGRAVHDQAKTAIASTATPQQQAEAQSAGWQNPQDALALIVVRDALVKSGQSPDLANQVMAQLHSATKQGPEAVQAVLGQIQQLSAPQRG
jgi:hypothetical protein